MTKTITIPNKEYSIMVKASIQIDVTLQNVTIMNGIKITYSYDYINPVYLPQVPPNTRGELLVAHIDRHAIYDLGDPKLNNLKLTAYIADKKCNFSKLEIENVMFDCGPDDLVTGLLAFVSDTRPKWYQLKKIK